MKQEQQRLPPSDLNGQAAGKGSRAARGGSEEPGPQEAAGREAGRPLSALPQPRDVLAGRA